MRNEIYKLKTDPDAIVFEFTSVGPKGNIAKLVMYQETKITDLYNLAFGDKDEITGEINDMIVTNNKDSQKVLATVAETVLIFTNRYPTAQILAKGSTKSRTRLYRIGINTHLEEIKKHFRVYGLKDKKWYLFKTSIEYDAYLIKPKKKK